jgi:hypothetical protein
MILINVSDAMFNAVMTRAKVVAEERFRRMVIDTHMNPEAVELLRDRVVNAIAEDYVEQLAEIIATELEPQEKPRPAFADNINTT